MNTIRNYIKIVEDMQVNPAQQRHDAIAHLAEVCNMPFEPLANPADAEKYVVGIVKFTKRHVVDLLQHQPGAASIVPQIMEALKQVSPQDFQAFRDYLVKNFSEDSQFAWLSNIV